MTYVGLYFCSAASIHTSTKLYSFIVERSSQGIYTGSINTEYCLKSHRTAQIRLFSQLINVESHLIDFRIKTAQLP